MAQHEPGDVLGITDKNKATAGSAAKSTEAVATVANYASHADLDARLTAISATTFSQSRLDSMTLNDKVYALRVQDDPGTF